MRAPEKLKKRNDEGKFICIGLDTDLKKIPPHLLNNPSPIIEFNRLLIQETAEYAAAYKLNFAFYEVWGSKGFEIMQETLSFIPKEILTIGDAKRGDIGNTAEMYARSVFEHLKFDSVTINPFMGKDSVAPFLAYSEKLVFMLVLTSNPGSGDFEKLELKSGGFLFQEILLKINQWNNSGNCGIVFGATKSRELRDNIKLFNDMPVLLPGIGAQGGDLEDIVSVFKTNERKNFIMNIGRGIIYKDSTEQFSKVAKNELLLMNNRIGKII
jgi:orotidine-5'-phosphate decarboxylase